MSDIDRLAALFVGACRPVVFTGAGVSPESGELHRLGRLSCCITQNVDGLRQRAGLPPAAVIELHGNATRARCLDCGAPCTRGSSEASTCLDCAACGGTLKPFTILFGETMPREAVEEPSAGPAPPCSTPCACAFLREGERRWLPTTVP